MAVTTHNIIFKLRLLWSLGLWDGFGEEFQQTPPSGFMNTGTLGETELKEEGT
ncbi:hypothetical protein [Paenibacillus sp. 203]|uniref:hypothetical protein n=1 Tax=Paenibacillus sp. 203 TaxID=3096765 RepID=UPI001F3AE418|nr:hypothetical protein [Paenibacillus sp. UKAQ_18]